MQSRIENVTINENKEKEEIELYDIGKINKNIIGEYGDKIITDNVIITDERIEHIELYMKIINYGQDLMICF